jgi:hypothetical protein
MRCNPKAVGAVAPGSAQRMHGSKLRESEVQHERINVDT